MDEELETPIILAIINYSGAIQPVAHSFLQGQFLALNLTIDKNGDVWELMAQNRQDFEQGHELYLFSISIEGTTARILLHVSLYR